ncbi:arginine deiminase [Thermanaerovibrio acidaminovorans]|uniref:arginine deiminase n=1 Tax=Thermanaerovibrio acidaminovorans TaxID=81462 RepID=UPI002492A0E2|nr:arginine deiminase [Thermanaerovibrio acidaminovorans]
MKPSPLKVTSEIGRLRSVLLHRPGKEVENLTPDLMARLLFDDIPYLKIAQEEHDAFAKVLRDNGSEVLYLEDLAAEALEDRAVREQFIDEYLAEANIQGDGTRAVLRDFFLSMDVKPMVLQTMAGVRRTELPREELKFMSLADRIDTDNPLVVDPMPNLYFTRDPFATIGTGITLNHMRTETRNRETLYAKYIFNHHPKFKGCDVPFWYDRTETTSIEGGDELVLSPNVLAIGISERTDAASIEKLARKLFSDDRSTFKQILAFNIPKKRAFMHLDTVFTMVDRDKFTIHPEIEGPLQVFSITPSCCGINIEEERSTLENVLAKALDIPKVTLIRCAGGDPIDAPREQWNDGSNTLAIAPGEVVVYSRNYVTNQILQDNGIVTHIVPSSELSRGRGGPRCMSMPLVREDL